MCLFNRGRQDCENKYIIQTVATKALKAEKMYSFELLLV